MEETAADEEEEVGSIVIVVGKFPADKTASGVVSTLDRE